jgi:hypothetical protein
MSARPAPHATAYEQPASRYPRRYSFRVRATIIIGAAAGIWVLIALAGWYLYSILD